jgi:hypothetical protein
LLACSGSSGSGADQSGPEARCAKAAECDALKSSSEQACIDSDKERIDRLRSAGCEQAADAEDEFLECMGGLSCDEYKAFIGAPLDNDHRCVAPLKALPPSAVEGCPFGG